MAPNSSIVLHYRMYGLVRTCEVFGLQEPDVREALLDPEACQLAEDQIQEKALTFEDEADLSLRRFINAMSHWIDSATIPKDDDLRKELVSVKYTYDSKGKHKVESKPELKKRIGRSPDRADALALACFGIDGGEVFCEQFDIGRSFAR